MKELTSMGFADEERNRTLLAKYAGRMDRVVEARLFIGKTLFFYAQALCGS